MKKLIMYSLIACLIVPAAVVLVACGGKTVTVNWTGISANGEANDETTTLLTLTFDVEPTGLTTEDITITGATIGGLTRVSATSWTLGISDIAVDQGENVNVAISKKGFKFTPANRDVAVNVAPGIKSVIIDFDSVSSANLTDLGQTRELTVNVVSVGGASTEVTWESSDPSVATIEGTTENTATVTVVADTVGTRTITITAQSTFDDTVFDTIDITVILTTPTITTTTSLGYWSVTNPTVRPSLLTATGSGPITWSVVTGSLPTGLYIYQINNATARISGTPIDISGTFTFTVRATNAFGYHEKQLSMTIRYN